MKLYTVFIRLSNMAPWALIKFLDLAEWALIRGGRLFEAGRFLNFHHFQQVVSLFCNKTVNNNKT